ncbi:uncharacterized protein LOC129601068 [Paramacrobiotus metropolitanus]|uniref:uncharacterized protein LOC129601068 n=1 Tax=Paramacrobiotus metropolitanus TaxID=2943436 RepID=UPI002446581D|nr:uncharacterized protein LOC129601068 [Paramacrobiotus metropolitanus]
MGLLGEVSSTSIAGGLVSVDFVPVCTKAGGILSEAEFECFPVILQRANEWLSKNPTLELKTCETVEFSTQSSGALVNNTESVYTLSGEGANRYVRALRLWLQPRADGSSAVQQIGYYNIMPTIQMGRDVDINTTERLDTLIDQSNATFATTPIQGSILTIETIALRVSRTKGVDPDCTAWTERGAKKESFIYMLRLFFETGPPQYESIGIADFVPGVLSEGRRSERPLLQRFPHVLSKAHQWLLTQSSAMRAVNVQTLLYKQRWTSHMDTLRMTYTEDEMQSYYVRYLRVAYVIANPNAPPRHGGPMKLNCKLFTPGMLEPPKCCNTAGKFENQLQVRERMSGWTRATAANVISVETIPMRVFSGAESSEGFDTMHTWNKIDTHSQSHYNDDGEGNSAVSGMMASSTGIHTHTVESKGTENYLTLYRVYLDGVYVDPPGYAEVGTSVETYMRQPYSECNIL